MKRRSIADAAGKEAHVLSGTQSQKAQAYILGCERTRRAAVDPLKENTGRYLAVAADHGLRLDYVIDTHSHADHRSGIWDLAALSDAKVVMERHAPAPNVDQHASHGDVLEVGDLRVKVLFTPGHTPDGISIYVDGKVLTGDILLIGGTGPADFAGGDAGKQYDAVTEVLFALPGETQVFPAHDYRGNHYSTIEKEKSSNPRVASRSRDEYIRLVNNLGWRFPIRFTKRRRPINRRSTMTPSSFPTSSSWRRSHHRSCRMNARIEGGQPPLILDVREDDEYHGELGYIRGSRLIPLRVLPQRVAETRRRAASRYCHSVPRGNPQQYRRGHPYRARFRPRE
jgi:glyoxylase-like metal-dependent hydrolase (beta-lactamase superfamily II)